MHIPIFYKFKYNISEITGHNASDTVWLKYVGPDAVPERDKPASGVAQPLLPGICLPAAELECHARDHALLLRLFLFKFRR